MKDPFVTKILYCAAQDKNARKFNKEKNENLKVVCQRKINQEISMHFTKKILWNLQNKKNNKEFILNLEATETRKKIKSSPIRHMFFDVSNVLQVT